LSAISAGGTAVRSSGNHAIALLMFVALARLGQAQEDDITRYLRSIEINQGQKVEEVVCIWCSVKVTGTVTGDVVAIGGDVEVSGKVGGDAIASGGRVRLLTGGAVEGEAVAVGGIFSNEGSAPPKQGAESVPYVHLPGQRSIHPLGALTFTGINCLSALIGGAILRSRRSTNLADAILSHPAATVISGCITMTIWVLLWMAFDTDSRLLEIGFWAGQVVTTVLLFCGCTGIAWLAGRLIFPGFPPFLKWPAGALIVSALVLIPVAGLFLWLAAMVAGFGAAVASGLGKDALWLRALGTRGKSAE
jgi:hypothetical protein